MAKDYKFDQVTPDMKGGINFWAKELGMGAANIRTAIRNKSLSAQLVQLYPDGNPALQGYEITGQQIMDWRANQHVRTGSPKAKTVGTHFVFKTSEKITTEQADAINAILSAAGEKVTLVKNARVAKKPQPVEQTEAIPADMLAALQALSEPEVENEEPAEVKQGFSLGFGRKK